MSFLNKRHTLIVTALAVLSAQTAWAQFDRINPVPQQIARPTKGGAAMMRLPDTWRVQTDAARSSSFAVKALRDGMPKATHEDREAAFVITLGVKGDCCTKKQAAKVPKRAEAYWLSADERGVTIVGADEQGLFYGVQSLLQSVAETSQLERGTVTDWPDVRFRGTVEGFYGTPWSHEARLRQIDFYGRNKLNTYIYGPKDDLYHRHRWRMPYPEEEAQRISELASYAREHGVNFCWAIHPGVDIRWNDADRDTLVAKLESVYKLGVRSFAVFFDDISGDGTDPARQAALLNHVNRVFIRKHKDVTPLMMCPTIYNRSWSTDDDKYLRTLGSQLDKDVDIMWTGNAVVADIDRESMEWINSRIGRKAYLWWNFPVSDYVRDRILLVLPMATVPTSHRSLPASCRTPWSMLRLQRSRSTALPTTHGTCGPITPPATGSRLLPVCSHQTPTPCAPLLSTTRISDLTAMGSVARRARSYRLLPTRLWVVTSRPLTA